MRGRPRKNAHFWTISAGGVEGACGVPKTANRRILCTCSLRTLAAASRTLLCMAAVHVTVWQQQLRPKLATVQFSRLDVASWHPAFLSTALTTIASQYIAVVTITARFYRKWFWPWDKKLYIQRLDLVKGSLWKVQECPYGSRLHALAIAQSVTAIAEEGHQAPTQV